MNRAETPVLFSLLFTSSLTFSMLIRCGRACAHCMLMLKCHQVCAASNNRIVPSDAKPHQINADWVSLTGLHCDTQGFQPHASPVSLAPVLSVAYSWSTSSLSNFNLYASCVLSHKYKHAHDCVAWANVESCSVTKCSCSLTRKAENVTVLRHPIEDSMG